METEKQFNIVLAEGKKELTDRVQALENDLKEKDEVILILNIFFFCGGGGKGEGQVICQIIR